MSRLRYFGCLKNLLFIYSLLCGVSVYAVNLSSLERLSVVGTSCPPRHVSLPSLGERVKVQAGDATGLKSLRVGEVKELELLGRGASGEVKLYAKKNRDGTVNYFAQKCSLVEVYGFKDDLIIKNVKREVQAHLKLKGLSGVAHGVDYHMLNGEFCVKMKLYLGTLQSLVLKDERAALEEALGQFIYEGNAKLPLPAESVTFLGKILGPTSEIPASLGLSVPSDIILQTLRTLRKMHLRGIYHRDIKPENFLISLDGSSIDFADFDVSQMNPERVGLKKGTVERVEVEEDLMSTVGTPGYIAPEIVRAERYSEKADVFSLGSVFIQTFLGKLPLDILESEILGRPLSKGHFRLLSVASNYNEANYKLLNEYIESEFVKRPYLRSYLGLYRRVIAPMIHPNPHKRPKVRDVLPRADGFFRELERARDHYKMREPTLPMLGR